MPTCPPETRKAIGTFRTVIGKLFNYFTQSTSFRQLYLLFTYTYNTTNSNGSNFIATGRTKEDQDDVFSFVDDNSQADKQTEAHERDFFSRSAFGAEDDSKPKIRSRTGNAERNLY